MIKSGDYIQLNCTVEPFLPDFVDVLTAELGDLGFDSFVVCSDRVEAYISAESWNEALELQVKNLSWDFMKLQYTVDTIASQNWNEVWEKNYFQPLLIGDCMVRAPFHVVEKNYPYEIVISPKMAFGTGNHATTSLMLKTIQSLDFEGKSVLDMGCGTGVLAILAAMRKAQRVIAIDYDIWSYESTLENIEINHVEDVQVIHGDAAVLKGMEAYDFIFANIQRNVLLNDMETYMEVLAAQGEILMSGFYEQDLEAITACAEALGLKLLAAEVQDKWVMGHFQRS